MLSLEGVFDVLGYTLKGGGAGRVAAASSSLRMLFVRGDGVESRPGKMERGKE